MLLALLCLSALTILPAADAQDYKLNVDPNSPSGREYAVPIDRARQDAADTPSKSIRPAGASAQAPLFGVGVAPADGAHSAKPARRGGGHRPVMTAKPASTDPPAALQDDVSTPTSGSGELVAIGGASAGILLVGLMVGVLVRRRSG